MTVSNHGQHKISVIIRQHNENVFDSQKSTDFFSVLCPISQWCGFLCKFLETQIKFLLLTPFLVSQINIKKRVYKFEAKLFNLFCFYKQHFNSISEEYSTQELFCFVLLFFLLPCRLSGRTVSFSLRTADDDSLFFLFLLTLLSYFEDMSKLLLQSHSLIYRNSNFKCERFKN